MLILLIFFSFQDNFDYALADLAEGPIKDFFSFSNIVYKGATFEWQIRNVQTSGYWDNDKLHDGDSLTIEIVNLLNGSVTYDFEEILYLPDEYPYYNILLNNQELDDFQQYLLIMGESTYSPYFYKYVFQLVNSLELNVYEPTFIFPLEFINGSETISYFDKFYEVLSQAADEVESAEVTKKENGKYIEIVNKREQIYDNSEKVSENRLSINTKVGVLGFYSCYYKYTDKLNDTNSNLLSYEIYSEEYSAREYRVGYSYLSFLLISVLVLSCMIYFTKRRK